MLFKNVVAAATLATVLFGTSLPSHAAFLIPLPEANLGATGPQGSQAGPFTYAGGGSAQALGNVAPNNTFNGGTGFAAAPPDNALDQSFSYFNATGTATSAFFDTTNQVPGVNSIVLTFTYQVLQAGTLKVDLFNVTTGNAVASAALNAFTGATADGYNTFTSANFLGDLAANTKYSIQWSYRLPDVAAGTAGFNNAFLQTEVVPEPSEALGLLGFGLAVYGGALQKKRGQKRAA
jgi:hypothetical protein